MSLRCDYYISAQNFLAVASDWHFGVTAVRDLVVQILNFRRVFVHARARVLTLFAQRSVVKQRNIKE